MKINLKKIAMLLSACFFMFAFSNVYGVNPSPDTPLTSTDESYPRGPDPTVAMLEADLGPFDVDTMYVSSWVSGFDGGTAFYPTNTSEGPFAAIAICPGYTATSSSIDWWGPRLASNGFVVIVIDTNSIYDQPRSRAAQLMAALNYIVDKNNSSSSPIYGLVDPNRLGVMGHSMGGGGTLIAADNNPQLKAAIPLAPWNLSDNFSSVTVPTMIVACENDTIAPVFSHASPFYNSFSTSLKKAFLEIDNGTHFCVVNGNSHYEILGKYGVSWMKRFLDNDTRYSPFLCGEPHEDDLDGYFSEISEYRENCPY